MLLRAAANINSRRLSFVSVVDPPFDCKGILENGIGTTDGVYSVVLNETRETIQVYCDMTSDGGGWTVRVTTLV